MTLTKMTAQVKEFMLAFENDIYDDVKKIPPKVAILRGNLIQEEIEEYGSSPFRSTEELDALCDLLYVVIGTAITGNVLLLPVTTQPPKLKQKTYFYHLASGTIQDLLCAFPCPKNQRLGLNAITEAAVLTALGIGYDLIPAFDEVHRTNMTKLWPEAPGEESSEELYWTKKASGYLVKRKSDGKVIKPPTFQVPNLKPFMP